jgi:hypothetical protein
MVIYPLPTEADWGEVGAQRATGGRKRLYHSFRVPYAVDFETQWMAGIRADAPVRSC